MLEFSLLPSEFTPNSDDPLFSQCALSDSSTVNAADTDCMVNLETCLQLQPHLKGVRERPHQYDSMEEFLAGRSLEMGTLTNMMTPSLHILIIYSQYQLPYPSLHISTLSVTILSLKILQLTKINITNKALSVIEQSLILFLVYIPKHIQLLFIKTTPEQ